MKSILAALEAGRLVELPDSNKEKALQTLALLLEAIPDIGTRSDIVAEINGRESTGSTALGNGIAVPHARSGTEGQLVCAVGWSPNGIEYNAPDGKPVRLIIMYYIPDSQRNVYLKELSGFAKAVTAGTGIESIEHAPDIHSVRNQLLDWVTLAIGAAAPDAKARMIKLQAAPTPTGERARTPVSILPFTVVLVDGKPPLVLARDTALMQKIEAVAGLAEQLRRSEFFDGPECQIVVRSSTSFADNRSLHECLAIRTTGQAG